MARTPSNDEMKKITVNVPCNLVNSLIEDSDENLTQMLVRLMKEERRKRAFKKFIEARGKIKFSLSVDDMRYDGE